VADHPWPQHRRRLSRHAGERRNGQPGAAAKYGGTLLLGINSGDPPTYECHQSTLFPIIHLLSPHYSNLLRIDLGNYPKVVGDLADSWRLSDDQKTLSFHLRSGIKFHDGSPSPPKTSRQAMSASAIHHRASSRCGKDWPGPRARLA